MANLVLNGKQQFLDINGDPLVGGKVYFYEVATSTPKNTYQDSDLTILNTNPVICDSRGQATIWGSGGFRQVLTDSLDNQIWDKTVTDASFISDGALTVEKLEDFNANTVLGAITAGPPTLLPCTAAGRSIIGAADAAAQRTALGLGTSATLDTGTDGGDVVTYAATSGILRSPNGLATAPVFSFTNDVDTGMYLVQSNTLGFTAAGVLGAQLDATGNFGRPWVAGSFGTANMCRLSDAYTLQVASANANQFSRLSADGSIAIFYRDTTQVGSINVTGSATSYLTSSDYRLKENVSPVDNALEKVLQLKPYEFNFIAEPHQKVIGILAHELQEILPFAVAGEKDAEEMQAVDHSKIVPLLIAAIQELAKKL